MTTVTEDRQLRVYCPTHRINFEVPESGRILCESGGHALALNFPHEGSWEYCCDCQVFWPSEMDKGGKAKESCPVCTRTTARRYLCHECQLVSIESDDPARRKSYRVGTSGEIQPACPGCNEPAGAEPLQHVCEETAAAFATTRSKCPFCEELIRKPEPVVPQEEKIFCGNCGTQTFAGQEVCRKCGGPVGKNSAGQGSRTDPLYVPPVYAEPRPDPVYTPPAPVTPAAPQKSSGGIIIAVGIVALLFFFVIAVALIGNKNGNDNNNGGSPSGGSQFRDKLDRALAANNLFSPSGDCVADLYNAEAGRSPNSSALAEAGKKISTKLVPIGDDAIQRYYAESDVTVDWDYIGKVYELLKKIEPENHEYSARYAYSLGLVNLKNKSYPTAVKNFQDALGYKPDWVMAYNGLGRVYVQDDWNGQNYSKTVEYYSKACDLDPSFAWGCRNLGAYYMKVDDWSSAETYMGKALQRSPGRDTIWKTMAKICPKVGKHQDSSTGLCVY